MPKQDNSNKPDGKQPQIVNISDSRIEYNADAIAEFLELVFHTDLAPGEEVLTWITKGTPGYPISEDELDIKLARLTAPRALYYSTATASRDETDDKLYNRKALFNRFHVLVLDDIGTKVPEDKIPETFEPTYIIETSEGNFQYGYVLENPLTVLGQAEALVQLAYNAGFSDAGGKMANKLVRLPGGVNGKKGDPGKFHVKLVKSDGPYWTPEDILAELNLGIVWEDIKNDADKVMKQNAIASVGLSPWSPIKSQLSTVNGIIDPVAEWLFDKGQVTQETGEWLTVKCPWAEGHTSPGDTAGYSPLGWGAVQHRHMRGFHCFHEHCAAHKIGDFLEIVASEGGPVAPPRVFGGDLTRTYAYDFVDDVAWKIEAKKQPYAITMAAFRNLHPHAVFVPTPAGRTIQMPETTAFIKSGLRVTVRGRTYDPTDSAKLVKLPSGELAVNMFTQPDWGKGPIDQKHFKIFMEFMEYLIPDEEQREYFLDWLAAKAQNMAFRGPAILMIAPKQGTGRTTLSLMISKLFGAENVGKVDFSELTGDSKFNDYLEKPLIVSDETYAVNEGTSYFRAYERLKGLIDPLPTPKRIEKKNREAREAMVYSSFLLFSNHANALKVAKDDRRIYTIDNARARNTPEYYRMLHSWWTTPGWEPSIWRWLLAREVDVTKLNAPPAVNSAKAAMMQANKTAIEVVVETILDNWPSKAIAYRQVHAIAEKFVNRCGIPDEKSLRSQLQYIIGANSTKPTILKNGNDKFRIAGTTSPIRMHIIDSKPDSRLLHSATRQQIEAEITKELTGTELADIIAAINDELEGANF